jgi:ethanolamine utilization protein EutM
MKEAIGFVETRGLIAAIAAADAMVKAAGVRIMEYRQVGSGLINITIQGEVASVQAAVDAGVASAGKVGEVLAHHVIPRPHEELLKVLSPRKEAVEP